MKTGYTVGQIMKKTVMKVHPGMSIQDVAQFMTENKIGSVLVTEGERLLGIVTDQDMTRRVIAEGVGTDALVSQVMTKEVWTVSPGLDINDAIEILAKHKVRHLPVSYGTTLLGIISYRDIIRIQPSLVELICVKQSLAEDLGETLLN